MAQSYTRDELVARFRNHPDTFNRRLQQHVQQAGGVFDLRPFGELQADSSLLIRDPGQLEAFLRAEQQRMVALLMQSWLETVFEEPASEPSSQMVEVD